MQKLKNADMTKMAAQETMNLEILMGSAGGVNQLGCNAGIKTNKYYMMVHNQ